MSKSKKPRRPYDPNRWLRRVEEGQQRRRGACLLSNGQVIDIGIGCRLALDTMRHGGDEASWYTLAAALNMSLILCERGIGEDYLPTIIAGQEALMRIKARANTCGSWAMDGAGRQVIETAIAVHEGHIEGCTHGEVRGAIGEVERRMTAGDVFEEAA
ncbi:hypothetical protein [Chitinasiproducens palmae]|uniref:Uncharacterized protein n=1 Tax=Chitinasiproducens palmae TaxID=1770053 RepID=A0A1H2PQW6_9BURK|nr:hypothetical protein [Chitinasiproducens palmae]SDV49215.1 hypothetical protein SAMN05216551_107158 [Chitinasiproducens palmae]